MNQLGYVWLVGAGPGDPSLITVRGRDALADADVVIYDSHVCAALVDLAPPAAERIAAGKRAGRVLLEQSEINNLLVARARAGQRVVRLKGGDPYVFARGAEEAAFLHAAGVPFEVVPGVTAALGAAAWAGIPLTHRGHSSAVALVTGHDDPLENPRSLDWPSLARFPGTLVFYMALARVQSICETLMAHKLPESTPAAIVENATWPRQRTIQATLATLPPLVSQAGVQSPALLIVGPVVNHHHALDWRKRLPLAGQRILVTRPADHVESAAASLETLGASVLRAPMVEIRPLEDPSTIDQAINRLSRTDWLIFTSRHGVRHFLDRVMAVHDARALANVRLAAIGLATAAELHSYHLRADLIAELANSEDLAALLRPRVSGQRVVLARASRGRDVLQTALAGLCSLENLVVYEQRDVPALPAGVERRLRAAEVDWVVFSSPAIVRRFDALVPAEIRVALQAKVRTASISPLTSETARGLGWNVAAEATTPLWENLVSALVQANSR